MLRISSEAIAAGRRRFRQGSWLVTRSSGNQAGVLVFHHWRPFLVSAQRHRRNCCFDQCCPYRVLLPGLFTPSAAFGKHGHPLYDSFDDNLMMRILTYRESFPPVCMRGWLN